MQTIVLAAAKGGVGKTTLVAALATAACLASPCLTVAVIDLDPQGSLTLWWNLRGSHEPHLVSLDGAPLRKVRDALARAGFDLLIVDCPPGFSSTLSGAIQAADLVVVPAGASNMDIEAVAATVEMAKRVGVPHCCVLNRAPFRSRLAGRALTALREFGTRVLPVVHHRVAVAEAMAIGGTALETQPAGAAARELTALWNAVRAELNRPVGRPSRLAAGNDRKIVIGMAVR